MTTVDDPSSVTTFSAALRAATWSEHQGAEQAPYIRALVEGELDRDAYAAMVDQHWHIYRVLEDAAAVMASNPVARAFVFPELVRIEQLEADLAALRGERWREQAHPLPATSDYCDRLAEVCSSWAGGYVAHAYTRYLGDLSGGQFIGRVVEKHYGFDGSPGAWFYRFDRVPDAAAFRAEFRARLDRAPWDAEEQQRIIDEVVLAYGFNTAVFEDLGRAHLPTA
jgi:heme oxygenase (biliverdin-producing, ferredoxin)